MAWAALSNRFTSTCWSLSDEHRTGAGRRCETHSKIILLNCFWGFSRPIVFIDHAVHVRAFHDAAAAARILKQAPMMR